MIWLLGADGDHTFHHMVRQCLAQRVKFQAVNLRAVVQRGEWRIPVTRTAAVAHLHIDGDTFLLEPQDAFFCRFLELDRLTDDLGLIIRWRVLEAALSSWLESIHGLVINKPDHATDNALKPWHEMLLAHDGFDVPAAIVSSDIRRLVTFASEGPSIVKSLSGVRSDAREITPTELAAYSPDRGPLHLQRRVRGHDVRAHVIHDDVFSLAIYSKAMDYRTAVKNVYESITLPASLRRAIVGSSRKQGLALAGWDFKVDSIGRYWCLECNPMPGFSGYDHHHDFAISHAIIRHLDEYVTNPHLSWTERKET